MCFNRFVRVSKQLNGIWHQLHFFSSLSWELSISPQKEVGEGIGVVSKMLKEQWTKIWVLRLDLCCWLLFSRISLVLAAMWDCLIISDFKDLFPHLRKKAWKRCTWTWNELWFGEKRFYCSPKIIDYLQKLRVPHLLLRKLCLKCAFFTGVLFPQHLSTK